LNIADLNSNTTTELKVLQAVEREKGKLLEEKKEANRRGGAELKS